MHGSHSIEGLFMLLLAVFLLGLGPVVFRLARRRSWVLDGLDGLVLVSVGLLVGMHILPDSIAVAGLLAVLAALVGLAAPMVLERLSGQPHDKSHRIVLWVALAGLLIHAAVDGMALAGGEVHGHAGEHLAQAVILHRLPVGVALWWLIRPTSGVLVALGVLAAMAVSTALGFFLAGPLTAPLGGTGVALFQALVAGSLLHVVIHRLSGSHRGGSWRLAESAGALLGLALVLFPSLLHGHHLFLGPYARRLVALLLETAPALFLGYLLAGLVKELMPQASITWMARGSAPVQAARGMLFGIPLPICSCGIVPIYQGLVERGLPSTAALAFLVATPEIGVESIILSYSLLGGELTLVRLLAAALVALGAGWVIGRTIAPRPNPFAMAIEGKPTITPSVGRRLVSSLRYGFSDVVADTAPWLILGLLVAAALEPTALAPLVARLPGGLDVVLFALAGIPVYVCASAATPLAAAFILVGVSPGAALAFLLSGPATNITTFGVLANLHGRRTAMMFGGFILSLTVLFGWIINLLVGSVQVPIGSLPGPEGAAWYHWASLGAVGLAFGLTLVRVGPRAFVGTVLSFGRSTKSTSHPSPEKAA